MEANMNMDAKMDQHSDMVKTIAATVRRFYEDGESFRVFHGSSNSTRPSHGVNNRRPNIVDISTLCNILLVDPERRIALAEPNVPMDKLVETTLPYNLVPPVVMEFPGITVGGGFSGTSGESSSFRHGFFDDTVNFVEMVLGNGNVVRASRDERPDLFFGAAGAVGTLGIVTLVEVQLVEAKKWVKTTYRRTATVADAISRIEEEAKNLGHVDVDYIDGIVFSPSHAVVITGQLTDVKLPTHPVRTFSNASDPWFYMHVQDITSRDREEEEVVEYIPLGEYLFRYDRAGFWVGRQGYTYFKVVPFTRFFRWLLDDYSHTRTLYHALHASGIASQFVVQDLALPYASAEEFINWVDPELGIWPLWLCPLRAGRTGSFHPLTDPKSKCKSQHELDENEKDEKAENTSQAMLNIGVWGWGPPSYHSFITKNRALEAKLAELRGRKWLYAHTYYTEDEFWKEYHHRDEYDALREKYFATTLPTVYDKVRVKLRGELEGEKKGVGGGGDQSWLSMWPIGGIYGMVRATLSGDIALHRKATWRYRG